MAKPKTPVNNELDPVVCYVLVRTDCPDWNVGKFFAQAHHNGCDLVESVMASDDPKLRTLYDEWKEDRNFGIALSLATTAAQCRQAISLAQIFGVHAMMTNDPTYPIRNGDSFVTASVDTVGFIFGRKSEVGMIVSQFELFSPKHVPA